LGGVRRDGRESSLEGRVIVDLVPNVPPQAGGGRRGECAAGWNRDRGRGGGRLPIDGRSGYPQGGAGCVIHGAVELHVALDCQGKRRNRRADAKVPARIYDCFYVVDVAPKLGYVASAPLVDHEGRVVAGLYDLKPRACRQARVVDGHVAVVVLVQAVGQVLLWDRN